MAILRYLIIFAVTAAPAHASAESPEAIFATASRSVFVVGGYVLKTGAIKIGSGVAVAKNYVVTNCHVISGLAKISILQGKTAGSAVLALRHPTADLCLLRVHGISLPPIRHIVPARKLRIGEYAYAIGTPAGLELTLTQGLISGIREINGQRVIQTSALISPGSSGGGLFDDRGRLVGITTFGMSGGAELNFALPADLVVGMLQEVKQAAEAHVQSSELSALSDEVRSALPPSISNKPPPSLVFRNPLDGQKWLTDMSTRLQEFIPNSKTRMALLVTVQYEATRAGIDPQLVLAMIEVLSKFREYAVSDTGALGYMQVEPSWVHLIGRSTDDLFHLRTNLRYGCTLLRYYLDLNRGNYFKALSSYRADSLRDSKIVDQPEFPDEVYHVWKTTWKYSGPTN